MIDFGLANKFSSKSGVGGTPGYMPPEVQGIVYTCIDDAVFPCRALVDIRLSDLPLL